MGLFWVVVVVGSLIGFAAWADHRRYRGLPVSPGLSGRAKRTAVRLGRARLAHLEKPARYSEYNGGGGGGP